MRNSILLLLLILSYSRLVAQCQLDSSLTAPNHIPTFSGTTPSACIGADYFAQWTVAIPAQSYVSGCSVDSATFYPFGAWLPQGFSLHYQTIAGGQLGCFWIEGSSNDSLHFPVKLLVQTWTTVNDSAVFCDQYLLNFGTVHIYAQPELGYTETSPATCLLSNGNAAAYGAGGNAPYTYSWSNGDFGTVATNLPADTVWVTITNAFACQASYPLVVGQISSIELGAEDLHPVCAGDSSGAIDITLFAGLQPVSFQWSTGDTLEDLTQLVAGIYTLITADANGCSDTVQIELIDPAALVAEVQMQYCYDSTYLGSLELQVSGGYAPYQILWENGDSTFLRDSLCVGAYSWVITDALGCSISGTDSVTGRPVSMLPEQKNRLEIYPNPTQNLVYIQYQEAQGAVLYLWDMQGNLVQKKELFQGENTLNLSEFAAGMYRIQIGNETYPLLKLE